MILRPERNDPAVAHAADRLQQRHAVEIEDGLGRRLVARLHAVAGEAQDVGHPHGGGTQHVALDGDAVAVAAGDLHDHGIARAGQQAADAHARHVHVGAGGVGGVDRIADFREHKRAVVDLLRVGGIRRVQLGGDGELALAQKRAPAGRAKSGPRCGGSGSPGSTKRVGLMAGPRPVGAAFGGGFAAGLASAAARSFRAPP